MHITSLPSPYGIGTFGKEAEAFVDWLKQAGQKYWQVLPIGPTGYGDSPYQSFSTFAGNPLLIDLDALVAAGLLSKEKCEEADYGADPTYVDFEKVTRTKMALLRKPNLIIALLLVYTTCMYIYFFPRNTEMSNTEKWTIVGVSYALLVALWFLLRRKERLRRERENDMNKEM